MHSKILGALAALVLFAGFSLSAPAQSLTTTYATDNNFAGNMFDVTASRNLRINSFDVHLGNAGAAVDVAVYWRPGTANGFENSATGWTLLGTRTVTSNGQGTPTPLPIGGLRLAAGQTYGLYIAVLNYPAAAMLYSNGSNVFSNSDLSLTTLFGKGDVPFAGGTFSPRQWNGTIYYGPSFTSCAAEGYTGTKLTLCQKVCESNLTGTTLNAMIRLYVAAFREQPACAL
jgi:hypothetical protein